MDLSVDAGLPSIAARLMRIGLGEDTQRWATNLDLVIGEGLNGLRMSLNLVGKRGNRVGISSSIPICFKRQRPMTQDTHEGAVWYAARVWVVGSLAHYVSLRFAVARALLIHWLRAYQKSEAHCCLSTIVLSTPASACANWTSSKSKFSARLVFEELGT